MDLNGELLPFADGPAIRVHSVAPIIVRPLFLVRPPLIVQVDLVDSGLTEGLANTGDESVGRCGTSHVLDALPEYVR